MSRGIASVAVCAAGAAFAGFGAPGYGAFIVFFGLFCIWVTA